MYQNKFKVGRLINNIFALFYKFLKILVFPFQKEIINFPMKTNHFQNL